MEFCSAEAELMYLYLILVQAHNASKEGRIQISGKGRAEEITKQGKVQVAWPWSTKQSCSSGSNRNSTESVG
jgi:hypothetical protein